MNEEREITIQMKQSHIDLMALMPCPIKVPFEKLVNDFVENTEGMNSLYALFICLDNIFL
ncbi:MAG TPA: hypothetical protein DIC60_10885 [Lachnospiraceae bacterium]|nr:hypothetical protein [Lachnospiraceae bacterium]